MLVDLLFSSPFFFLNMHVFCVSYCAKWTKNLLHESIWAIFPLIRNGKRKKSLKLFAPMVSVVSTKLIEAAIYIRYINSILCRPTMNVLYILYICSHFFLHNNRLEMWKDQQKQQCAWNSRKFSFRLIAAVDVADSAAAWAVWKLLCALIKFEVIPEMSMIFYVHSQCVDDIRTLWMECS